MQEKTLDNLRFIKRVDALQVALGISKIQTAAEIGVSEAMLSHIRRGKNGVTPKTWAKLHAAERRHGIDPPTSAHDGRKLDVPHPTPKLTKSQLRERLARLGERPVSDPSAVEETEAHLDQLAQREGEELLAEAQGWQPGQPLPPKTQALVDEMKRQLLRGLPAEAAAPSPPLRITKRKLPNDDDRAAAERWKAAYPLRGNYLLEDLLTFMAGDLLADGGHVLRLLVHDGYHFNPSGQIVS